jgi:hypothetical protein
MADETVHEGNDTPNATDDDIKRVDDASETVNADPGGAVEGHGVGDSPTDSQDTDENQDPKSGHSPV